jgi:DNA-binding transcriptional LysR family regulator
VYPEVHISVDCSYTLFDLTRNDFDLAFRATVNPPQNMVAKKLFDYEQTCCASPQYLAKYGRPQTIGELANHRCLTGSEKSTWTFDQQAHEVSGNLCVNDNHMLKQLALEHRGIILVAEYQVDQEIKRQQLTPVLTDHSTSTSALYLIHPQLIHQSARLSTFIQFTMDWFKNYLDSK